MQKALFALGIAAVLLAAGKLQAQDNSYEADRRPSKQPVRTLEGETIPSPQFLLYQRAARRSAERASRIETRKWYGVSPQRPTLRVEMPAYPILETGIGYFGYGYWPASYGY